MIILPQIAQITQRNAASCIISQRKTVSSGGVVVAVIVVWGLSAIISVICERLWGFFVCRLIEYSCVLFSRRWRKGMPQAALYRRERQIVVNAVIVVWDLSAIISVISERLWGSL